MEIELVSIKFLEIEDQAVVTYRFPDADGTYVEYGVPVPFDLARCDYNKLVELSRASLRERLEAHLNSIRY